MKEGRKNLIKDLHSVVGTVWQTSIETEFPKLFKEEALLKEAKRLGVKVRCLADGSVVTVQEMEFSFCKISGDFWVKQEEYGLWCLLFEDGVWATIVTETITKEQAEKELGKTIVD